jgi:hypothetical protein
MMNNITEINRNDCSADLSEGIIANAILVRMMQKCVPSLLNITRESGQLLRSDKEQYIRYNHYILCEDQCKRYCSADLSEGIIANAILVRMMQKCVPSSLNITQESGQLSAFR